MKHQTALLRFVRETRKWHSVNGNPRWKFLARTVDGTLRHFMTACDAGCAHVLSFSRVMPGEVIRVRLHETAAGTLMVDLWEDARFAGADLASQFAALEVQHQLRAETVNAPATQSQIRL